MSYRVTWEGASQALIGRAQAREEATYDFSKRPVAPLPASPANPTKC